MLLSVFLADVTKEIDNTANDIHKNVFNRGDIAQLVANYYVSVYAAHVTSIWVGNQPHNQRCVFLRWMCNTSLKEKIYCRLDSDTVLRLYTTTVNKQSTEVQTFSFKLRGLTKASIPNLFRKLG